MLRGINRQNLFEEDEDRQKWMQAIDKYKGMGNYVLYGYCLMDNHIHLLMKEMGESISQAIKRISSSYVYWYNQKYNRCGHLFQERFKSEAVETDAYFLSVLRYIHQNPIRGNISKDAKSYLWSSYHEYIGTPVMTDIDFALHMFSSDKSKALTLFQAYMDEATGDEYLDDREKISLSDKEVLAYLNSLGVKGVSELQRSDKERRDDVLRKAKKIEGVSIRQLARITGISKSVIDRI